MSKDLLCLHEDEAKTQLGKVLLVSMQKAGDIEQVFVTSISVPSGSRIDCRRRSRQLIRNPMMNSRISRALLATGAAAKIEMLVCSSHII